MDFNSIEALYAQLEKDAKESLLQEGYKLQEKGRDYIIEKIYSTYTPEEDGYDRTNEFMNSIQVKYTPTSNGFELSIYISEEVQHSMSNWKNGTLTVAPYRLMYNSNEPESQNGSMAKVAQYFAEGWGYGEERFGKRLDVMLEIAKYVDSGEALKDIINHLQGKGYDIV